MTLVALADRTRGLRGWSRAAVAVALGALAALAMAPYGVLPALVVAMTGAVWLLDGTRVKAPPLRVGLKAAAVIGWCFGFGFFVAGLWWLGAAFLVDNDEFAWALPLGVVGLPAGLALFTAASFVAARLLWSAGPARVLVFAAALGLGDYVRGHVLTGFPWNAFGMALGEHVLLAQFASVVGLYGLSVIAVALGAAPATTGDAAGLKAVWLPPAAAGLLLAALAAYGALRLPVGPVATVPGVKLRIMQPNLAQDARRFSYDNREPIMRHYLALSDGPDRALSSGASGVTHLIWPESAFPFILARNDEARAQIAALLPPGVILLTGAARSAPRLPGEITTRFFNALQIVADDGGITGTYDKVHLVPFGEYLPLGDVLQGLGLRQFVHVPGGFSAGSVHELLHAPGLPPVAPLICYEAIFPGAVVPAGDVRPGLLLNVTNDAWFGDTPGPYQHFSQARLRAIEEGLPLVRAANTGISAVVDPYGRMVASLPLGKEGVLDAALPSVIVPTPYSLHRDLLFAILIACCFLSRTVSDRREAMQNAEQEIVSGAHGDGI
ncbi:apolipoprotein N-acyltransferase [Chelatococcus reniformis]|uniref:Apolipoprotein N-acyltransferase n=1 Tax=Chelatococcus reniformis TaxID=1494448 RepID=A0A916XQQ7_9HYPH|nr:apolipoprotein N-acyltransferase [Chelatococcus reniformis]GGC93143.1 apolipoprotein N-acyltransferase [Chelatococcus reniformis]